MKKLVYFLLFSILISCTSKEAQAIKLNTDGCDFCKMTITNGKFGAEIITSKGRVYKFDDIHCMISYYRGTITTNIQSFYIHDFKQDNTLIPAETAFYVTGDAFKSPMHGNTIAVKTEEEALKLAKEFKATPVSWSEIIK